MQANVRTDSRTEAEVVIVGAGIAGLTAAAYLRRAGLSVTVLESHTTVGGQARTEARDGYSLNLGPHALYQGGAGEAVLKELGVLVRGGKPKTGDGQVMFEGSLAMAPGGAGTLLRTKSLTAKEKFAIGKMLGRLPKLDPRTYAGVTVSQFVDDAVSTTRARQLAHAVFRLSTYGNRPEALSAEVGIAQLQSSLTRGVLYLDNGWGQLVTALSTDLDIATGVAVDDLPDVPVVIVANGSPQRAGKLLNKSFVAGPATEVSCLDLGITGAPPHNFVLGGDEAMYLSNYSAVADLAPHGHSLVSVAQYLRADEAPDSDRLDAFAKRAGVSEDAVVLRRRLHRMVTVTAIATAENGGLQGRPSITDSGHRNVFLAGDWVGHEGHLADASFASGRASAMAAIRYLDAR